MVESKDHKNYHLLFKKAVDILFENTNVLQDKSGSFPKFSDLNYAEINASVIYDYERLLIQYCEFCFKAQNFVKLSEI